MSCAESDGLRSSPVFAMRAEFSLFNYIILLLSSQSSLTSLFTEVCLRFVKLVRFKFWRYFSSLVRAE